MNPPEGSADDLLALDRTLRAYMVPQLIRTAVSTGIVDALLSGPADAGTIAQLIDGNESAVLRVLRGLVLQGLALVEADGTFSATSALEHLGPDRADSLRDAALFLGGASYAAWERLAVAVKDGECPYARAHGADLWDHMAANPQAGAAFNGAMRGFSQPVQRSLAQSLELASDVVVDVGGGHGHLLCALLEANEQASGVVFDQPHLEGEAARWIETCGLAGRCRFAGGDFFAAVPNCDVCLLKWILHDWSDEDCLRILRRCREAIASDGRIVIIERPLPELGELAQRGASAMPVVMADLQMLVMGGPGTFQERSEREYGALLDASGFALHEQVPLLDGFAAFIAAPA